jgi:hypothetical protein
MTLDLSKLTIKDSAEAPATARRGREAMENPFTEVIADSWNRKQPKSVTVPNDELNKEGTAYKSVVTVVGLIRRAAALNDLGVSVEEIESENGKRTEIRFMAKEKTERKRKTAEEVAAENTEPASEIPAA